MGKSQRDKGKRGERLACSKLREVFPFVGRDLNDIYNKQGIDLVNTENLGIQVKHFVNHASLSKLNEVKPRDGRIPVLISWPTNRKDAPAVVLSLDDFITILNDIGVVFI